MKLKLYLIAYSELQDYLDKYQDKIKFILDCTYPSSTKELIIIIDEA